MNEGGVKIVSFKYYWTLQEYAGKLRVFFPNIAELKQLGEALDNCLSQMYIFSKRELLSFYDAVNSHNFYSLKQAEKQNNTADHHNLPIVNHELKNEPPNGSFKRLKH